MKYHQRDIVEVSFLFPDGTFRYSNYAILVLVSRW